MGRNEAATKVLNTDVSRRSPYMNRRQHLKILLRAASACCIPFDKLFSPSPVSVNKTSLWPQYVDVAEKAGLNSKTVILGHETKDFLLSTTGGGVEVFSFMSENNRFGVQSSYLGH